MSAEGFGGIPPMRCSLLICLILAGVPCVTANVMPEAMALVHVVPNTWPGPGLGPAPEIQTCEDVQQYTQELGRIECDVVIYPVGYLGQNLLIHSVEAAVQWPESWQYLGWERCGLAIGSLLVDGNQADLHLHWSPPRYFPNEAFLVARLLFEAPDPGELTFPEHYAVLELGDGVTTFSAYAWGIPGRAGVQCGDCTQPCGSPAYCRPSIEPEQVEVLLSPGSSAQATFTVEAMSGVGPGFPCSVSFEASDPWMAIDVTQIDWMTWELTVTVNATGLESGDYRGWIRSTTWCTVCGAVDLTVTGTAGVEAEPAEPAEPPEPASWGRIKHGFH